MSSTLLEVIKIILFCLASPLFFIGLSKGIRHLGWMDMQWRRKGWYDFAAKRGWDISTTDSRQELSQVLEIRGLHQGHPVSLLNEQRRFAKRAYDKVIVRVDLGATVPRELSLTSGDPLFTFFRTDTELGDAAPDHALLLMGTRPAVRELLLAPRVRQHLRTMTQSCKRFSLEEGRLEAEPREVPESPETLEALMAPALGLVDALDEAAQPLQVRRA